MLPFEMRTVLNRISLFIDTHKIVGQHFISKRKWWRREQDRGETERECVCEVAHGGKGEIASVIK